MDVTLVAALVAAVSVLAAVLKSVHRIGPAEVGLVIKNLGFKKLHDDDPIAFGGEAGYQAELLMAGLRFRFWPVFSVSRFPWVQVPAGETGVVIAQVGQPLPIGNKSAVYKPEFGNFSDVADFISNGGEKGVQRPVPPPGTLVPIHPVAFVVVTSRGVFGRPVSPELATLGRGGTLAPQSFGLTPEQLQVVVIAPQGDSDVIGLVTTLEGAPLTRVTSRRGSAASTTWLLSRKAMRAAPTLSSSTCSSARRTWSTTTTRTSRPSSTPAAGSGCSTTRSCTAPTC